MSKLHIIFEGEEYKEINDYPNYFISRNGDVFSLKSRRLLEPYKIPSGHYLVKLRNGAEKPKNCYIHRLVAETWLPNSDNLPIIHHKDGNITNNNVNNLEWVSEDEHKASMTYFGKNKRAVQYKGIVYESVSEMAEALEITKRTIYNWITAGKVTYYNN